MIAEKTPVCLVADPTRTGVVLSVQGEGDMAQYSVFMDGSYRVFFEEQIRPVPVQQTNWVDRATFRAYLTSCLINTPSARNLYSLNAARIDYVPYQFRPALKILKADEPRILIADSVGVGKTIEAGLIIKELEAHAPLNRIAIICPKPLVAERKWEEEMRTKFDETFTPLDGETLRMAISETDRDGHWPDRLSRVIIPYSIFDQFAYAGNVKANDPNRRRTHGRIYGLLDVVKDLHFDLVIVDEAHHIRNGSELAEKAFSYKCTKIFCDQADAVVMLTATPLQNRTRDLFTLLNVLRPDIIIDESSFEMMAEPNPFISHVSSLARSQGDGWRATARGELAKVETTSWGRTYIMQNPRYAKCRDLLARPEELTREERIAFINDVESLHSFNSLINRTRRRDIDEHEFCVREPVTIEIPFTLAQQQLNDALLVFERQALAVLHGEHGLSFMMTTIKRQAASCIFGLVPFLEDILDRRLTQLDTAIPENETQQIDLNPAAIQTLRNYAANVLALGHNLPPDDAKADAVIKVIREKQELPKNKVMLFSGFRHTLAYLLPKLKAANLRVEQIDGSVNDAERLRRRERFMLPKEDPDSIDVMLFTEVGSEGLDYQFCDMMVNYDLPWNPMAVEQRIGRIDRRKQTSEKVRIVNVITPNTVDADIYNRCLQKLGIFTESIGECEEILGGVEKDIRAIVLNEGLTDEQRRMQLEQLADNAERRRQAELALESEQKAFFGLDLTNFKDATAIDEAKSPWLTADCLQGLIAFYFNHRIGAGSYFLGAGSKKTLRLGRAAKDLLLDDLKAANLPVSEMTTRWQSYLRGDEQTQTVTFDAAFAQQTPDALFFTPVHPLVKIAAASFERNQQVTEPCIAFRCAVKGMAPGRYPFAVYTWNYTGFTAQFKMVTVPLDERLQNQLPEIVQNAENFELAGDASDYWRDLDPIHTNLWRRAKTAWVADTQQMAAYRKRTLEISYKRKSDVLQDRIAKAVDPRMKIMHTAQLEHEKERYEAKLVEIENTAARADIIFRKIANGVILVEG